EDAAGATMRRAEHAPVPAPIARDARAVAAAVHGPEAEHVAVDVLANDSDPAGSISGLEVTLDDPPDGTEVRDDKTGRVTPQDEQQRIRYIIEDADELTSRATSGCRAARSRPRCGSATPSRCRPARRPPLTWPTRTTSGSGPGRSRRR